MFLLGTCQKSVPEIFIPFFKSLFSFYCLPFVSGGYKMSSHSSPFLPLVLYKILHDTDLIQQSICWSNGWSTNLIKHFEYRKCKIALLYVAAPKYSGGGGAWAPSLQHADIFSVLKVKWALRTSQMACQWYMGLRASSPASGKGQSGLYSAVEHGVSSKPDRLVVMWNKMG